MRATSVQYAAAPSGRKTGALKYAILTSSAHFDGSRQMIKRAMDASFFWSLQTTAFHIAEGLARDGWGVASVVSIEDGRIEVIHEFAQNVTIARSKDEPEDYEDGGSW